MYKKAKVGDVVKITRDSICSNPNDPSNLTNITGVVVGIIPRDTGYGDGGIRFKYTGMDGEPNTTAIWGDDRFVIRQTVSW